MVRAQQGGQDLPGAEEIPLDGDEDTQEGERLFCLSWSLVCDVPCAWIEPGLRPERCQKGGGPFLQSVPYELLWWPCFFCFCVRMVPW